MRSLLLAACAVSLGGCLPSAFDGTWLFLIEYDVADVSGDCVSDDDSDYEVVYEGTQNMLVDMYTTNGGGLVVLWEDALYGTHEGSSFEVESEQYVQVSSDGYQARQLDSWVMEADREGTILTGEVTDIEREEDNDGYSYQCETTWDFTAERVSSPQSRYPED